MFELEATSHFQRRYKRLVKANPKLKGQIDHAMGRMLKDPMEPGLKSHVTGRDIEYGNTYTARVTGDVRIRWAYRPHTLSTLILLDVGGHDDVY